MAEEQTVTTEAATETISDAGSQDLSVDLSSDQIRENALKEMSQIQRVDSDSTTELPFPTGGEDDPLSEDVETEASETTEETAVETVAEPAIDDELASRAEKFLGWTKEQLSAIGNPQLVEQAIYSALSRQFTSEETRPPEEQPAKEPAKPEPAKPTQEDFDFYKSLADEGYDETVIKALQARDVSLRSELQKQYESKMSHVESQMAAISEHLLGQEKAQWERKMDDTLASMGEQYQSILGKGSGYEMNPKSTELQNRVRVLDLAETMRDKYISAGEKPPSDAQLAKMALNGLFADKIQSVVRKELANKVSKRSRQTISRPSNSQSRERFSSGDVEKDAIKEMTEFARASGIIDEYGRRIG